MGYNIGVQSNHFKEFSLTIDGIKIVEEQIISLMINWDINHFKITGSLSWKDGSCMVEETPIRGGNTVVINMTDFDGASYSGNFKVLNTNYERSTDFYISTISFIDTESFNILKLYPTKSWLQATMVQIIDDAKTAKPFLTSKGKEFNDPGLMHENFVVPQNKNFYWTIEWLKQRNNRLMFQNREKYIIDDFNTLINKGVKGKPYYFKANNASYKRNVYEYSVKNSDFIKNIATMPNVEFPYFNVDYKHKQQTKGSYADASGAIGGQGTLNDFSSNGDKFSFISNTNFEETKDFYFQKNALSNLVVEILVPGQCKTNLGDVVCLEFDNLFEGKGPEKNIKGKFLIVGLTDIFQNPEYLQKLTLARPKWFK